MSIFLLKLQGATWEGPESRMWVADPCLSPMFTHPKIDPMGSLLVQPLNPMILGV